MPVRFLVTVVLCAGSVWAQLPEGPGRDELTKLCKQCHDLGKAVSVRQDRDAWRNTLTKMAALGTKGTDQEFALILDYVAKHYPADEVPPVNINKASAIELESRLGLRRSQAAALIAYRTQNGKFRSIEDLKNIPNLDFEKIEARKDRIVF